ncbi:heterokaryon incompatibility Het-C [Auriculariales sp. MPI-PUGE-AT-0066]|nr:heterokaryon incompatibility Het-C [Auriculariales sp. MPI-PUGE-AT-0066]
MTHKSSVTVPVVLLTVLVVLSFATSAHAFGAGETGDIENVIKELVKVAGAGGGIFAYARSGTKGKKFSSEDVKRIYFAMDIGGLSKLTAETLVLVVSVLGFLEFGFATEEYQVTAERLGVYLPVEHIDNPKGYAAIEGDARQFHPWLRPPVDPRELEIDHRNGMKNYMATEDGGWDTSTLFIRRSLRAAIDLGWPETFEAFRLMGQALHTLEDLLAHSNWCEVGLRRLGFVDVFCHVGERVLVDTPFGPAPPLVTGTFTSRDLVHSLLGEAADHLSQTSVVDLSHKIDEAAANDNGNSLSSLKGFLGKVLGGSGNQKANEAEQLESQSKAYHFDPNNVASPEVVRQLHDLLIWRDGVMRDIQGALAKISNGVNTCTFIPYLSPILQQVVGVLHDSSTEVIEHEDQYEVFNEPYASDPTHSVMSKDHFGLILNEPAGKIAKIVVTFAVNHIVAAWQDTQLDPDRVISSAFHHPYYATGESAVQNAMAQELAEWIHGLDPDEQQRTIAGLTKESVRDGMNKRISDEEEQEIMRVQEEAGHAPPPTDFDDLQGVLAGVIGGGIAGFAADAIFNNENDGEERQVDFGGEDEDAGVAWREEQEYQQPDYPEDEHQFEVPEELEDVGDSIQDAVEELW